MDNTRIGIVRGNPYQKNERDLQMEDSHKHTEA
jgi:hypothetical protein